jgi:hypothetical protein
MCSGAHGGCNGVQRPGQRRLQTRQICECNHALQRCYRPGRKSSVFCLTCLVCKCTCTQACACICFYLCTYQPIQVCVHLCMCCMQFSFLAPIRIASAQNICGSHVLPSCLSGLTLVMSTPGRRPGLLHQSCCSSLRCPRLRKRD